MSFGCKLAARFKLFVLFLVRGTYSNIFPSKITIRIIYLKTCNILYILMKSSVFQRRLKTCYFFIYPIEVIESTASFHNYLLLSLQLSLRTYVDLEAFDMFCQNSIMITGWFKTRFAIIFCCRLSLLWQLRYSCKLIINSLSPCSHAHGLCAVARHVFASRGNFRYRKCQWIICAAQCAVFQKILSCAGVCAMFKAFKKTHNVFINIVTNFSM